MEEKPLAAPVIPNRQKPKIPSELRDPKALALAIAEAAWSKNAYQTRVLDVHRLVDYADVFVVLTGRSERHVTSIAEAIAAKMKERGAIPAGIEGRKAGTWVLLDFGDVVVHVFERYNRDYYDIDGLWADSEEIPVEEPAWVKDFTRMESEEY